jgi:hypothetical protein
MEVTAGIPDDPTSLALALEGWIDVSRQQLRDAGGAWLPLYKSGIRYQREPRGRERWQTASETRASGIGDCEDLVIARVAELRELGEAAARPYVYRTARSTLHTVVHRADGTLEDPSRVLGMGTKMGAEPTKAKVKIEPCDGGKRATLKWRNDDGVIIAVSADAVDEASATTKASAVAKTIVDGLHKEAASSPAADAIMSLVPPQVTTAIKAAQVVARLAQSGELKRYAGKLTGGAKKLAKLFGR